MNEKIGNSGASQGRGHRVLMGGVKFALMAGGAFAAVSSAHASLIGDTIQVRWMSPDLTTAYEPPITITAPNASPVVYDASDNNAFNLQFSANGVVIASNQTRTNQFNAASFNGLILTDLTDPADFSSVALIASNWKLFQGTTYFDASRISISNNQIFLNFTGMENQVGDAITLAIGGATPVPEPATLAVLGFGLAGLIACRRRA